MQNYVENGVIHKARVTLVQYGYGDLSLTDKALFWNKSATSLLAFGALGAVTDNHILFPFEEMAKVGTYTYLPGGGITLLMKDGREHKIAFKKKKDFSIIYDYLTKVISSNH
jgi:hypothetical protein